MVMNGFISWYLILEKSPQKRIQAKGYSPQSVTWNLKMMENSQKTGGCLAINWRLWKDNHVANISSVPFYGGILTEKNKEPPFSSKIASHLVRGPGFTLHVRYLNIF